MVYKRYCVMCRKVKDGFFASFPLDEKRCRVWVQLTGDPDLVYVPIEKLKLNRFLCGIHFGKKDFTKTGRFLKRSAIPKLHLPKKPLTEEQLYEFPSHVYSAEKKQPSNHSDHDKELKKYHKDHSYSKLRKSPSLTYYVEKQIGQDGSEEIQDDLEYKQDDVRSPSPEVEEPEIDLNMCRICLQSFSKLISIESYGLRTAYEQLTGVSVEHDDGLPRELCVECATLLDKYHKFRDKSIKGDQLLRQIYVKKNEKQSSKPLEEIEESINSLASTIDYSSEMTIIEVEPKQMIEQMCQCDMEKEVIAQNLQDLEMSVVDDEEFYITHDIDTQMMESDNLDQQNSTDNVTAIDSSDNEGFDSPMTKEEELYIVKINRNKILENKSIEEMNSDDDISIKEEEDELADPLHSVDVTRAQDCNLIEMNYNKRKLSFREQMQQHCERGYSLRYLTSLFKCPSCFQGFGSKKCYETHMELSHSMEISGSVCMICRTRYASHSELVSHTEVTHLYRYECKHCKNILFNRKSALRHIKTHIGPLIS